MVRCQKLKAPLAKRARGLREEEEIANDEKEEAMAVALAAEIEFHMGR